MLTLTLTTAAVALIAVHGFWCLLSRRVSDGIVGKILYLALVLAAMGVLSHPHSTSAMEAFMWSIAAISGRHFWMKTFWPRLRSKLLNRIRCATCPHKD